MEHLLNYKVDRKKDSYQIGIELKNFIENFVSQKYYVDLLSKLSKITDIPEDVLANKSKKILSMNFDYERGKFNKKLKFFSLFKDFIFYLWINFCSIFFSKKNNEEEKCFDLILDDVDEEKSLITLKRFLSFFEKSLVIFNKKPDLNKLTNIKSTFFTKSLFIFDKNYLKNKNLLFFKFFFSLFIYSFKYKINFFFLFNLILFQILRYETIFRKFKSKVLVQERFFSTCPIKQFLFKKNGGLISCCFQKNIPELTISLFINSDVIFTLGKENDTKKRIAELGGNVKNFIPVGSLEMETRWYLKERDLSNVPDIDVLVIGLNPIGWFFISEQCTTNYYNHIKWIKDFSLEFPKINIYLKHHDSNDGRETSNDPVFLNEQKILSGSNVKTLIASKSSNGTYAYMEKSKAICSWGSTMILEGLGNGKECFFMDPNLENSTFFEKCKELDNLRIKTYEEFKSKILLLVKKNETGEKKYLNQYCLKSDEVSQKAFNFLNKY